MTPIPNWRNAHRLWTVQLAIFWAFVSAAFYLLPVIQIYVGQGTFILLTIVLCVSIALARVTHQPGID